LTVEPKGFLASLFDTSFSSLVTPRVIKVIYIISMVVIGLAALFNAELVTLQRAATPGVPAASVPPPAAAAPPPEPPTEPLPPSEPEGPPREG